MFVYRGEESSVFNMKLEGNEGTNGESNSVNLLVFGEHEAVPFSITKQLSHLLQKNSEYFVGYTLIGFDKESRRFSF